MTVRDHRPAQRYRRLGAMLVLSLTALPLQPAENLLIVGGGPTPEDSQVSIERNVVWIDALTKTPDYAARQLLFTAGPEKVKDVVEKQDAAAELQHYLPLARIFGTQDDALSIFRPNALTHIDGDTSARSLDRQLARMLSQLKSGDALWFIYNGHGGMESSEPSENTLRLWNDSTLDVQRYAAITQARPKGTILRSFMPQCFSGGFARSIAFTPTNPDADHIDRLQCGFYSVPHNLESEGCTISVDSNAYRDYSTFFFAALSGKTRQGKPLDTDTTGGKANTLLDAHVWAYINGDSTDIPFSSSEYFLELWLPWYARWQTVTTITDDNPYFHIATAIARKEGIPATSLKEMAISTGVKITGIREIIGNIRSRLESKQDKEAALRKIILQAFIQHFPEAGFPYSGGWSRLLREKGGQMLRWIEHHDDYRQLEKLQQDVAALDRQLLEERRVLTTHVRLQRMLKLATIREIFFRIASPAERNSYQALLTCESWSPPLATSGGNTP